MSRVYAVQFCVEDFGVLVFSRLYFTPPRQSLEFFSNAENVTMVLTIIIIVIIIYTSL